MKSFVMYLEAKLGLEVADQILHAINSLRLNLYYRTRPLRPVSVGDRKTPVDHLRYFREKILLIRDWITRNDFPVSLKHMDAAYAAAADAMIDLHSHVGEFVPSAYHKGADPSAAETLGQFATFLHKRVNQKPVPHPILQKLAEEWDVFFDDFYEVYKRMKDAGELPTAD